MICLIVLCRLSVFVKYFECHQELIYTTLTFVLIFNFPFRFLGLIFPIQLIKFTFFTVFECRIFVHLNLINRHKSLMMYTNNCRIYMICVVRLCFMIMRRHIRLRVVDGRPRPG